MGKSDVWAFNISDTKSKPKRKSIPLSIKKELYDKRKGICEICKKHYSPIIMDIDHKKPLSEGGSDRYSNLQLLCKNCHGSKTHSDSVKKQKKKNFKSKEKFSDPWSNIKINI